MANEPKAPWREGSSPAEIGPAPKVPAHVVDLRTLTQWMADTCLTFGSKASTAFQVAGKVAEQIEKDDANGR